MASNNTTLPIKMIHKLLTTASLLMLLSAVGSAQTQVGGDVSLSAGTGNTALLGTDLKLDISSQRLSLKPRLGFTIMSDRNSGQLSDIEYTYSGTGDEYRQTLDTQTRGSELRYGLSGKYTQSPLTTWDFSLEGRSLSTETHGSIIEILDTQPECLLFDADTHQPTHDVTDLKLQAGLRHKLHDAPHSWGLRLNAATSSLQQQSLQSPVVAIKLGGDNYLETSSRTLSGSLLFDYLQVLRPGRTLDYGARIEYRGLKSEDYQEFCNYPIGLDAQDKILLDETFRHSMTSTAAFVEYREAQSWGNLMARLEYAHTDMNGQAINDVVPTFRGQYNINKQNFLVLSYMMRIVRPELQLLNPAHIRGAFTLDYGNDKLRETHVNLYSLAHNVKTDRVRYSTTLSHIMADDGFNAIWMVKDGLRVSTWGNEGIRRAWSLTPDLEWKASATTQINAKVIVMWDKRIAEAIHMAKEHWGITTQFNVRQQLPAGIVLNAHADYSEGNTIDLYSHSGRMLSYGGDLQRSFLKNHQLSAQLSYSNTDYAKTILTQGAYTGTVYTRPQHQHILSLALSYRF